MRNTNVMLLYPNYKRAFDFLLLRSQSKIKRWKAVIDEHNAHIFYKPGKENYVADALSRQHIHSLEEDAQSDIATIHSDLSLTYTIEKTDKPVNCFWNQIIIEESGIALVRTVIMFGEKTRHLLYFSDRETLIQYAMLSKRRSQCNFMRTSSTGIYPA